MAISSSILAWKIPWTGEPGGLVRSVTKNRTRLSKHTTQVKLAPEVLNPLKLSGVLVLTVKQEQIEPIPSFFNLFLIGG